MFTVIGGNKYIDSMFQNFLCFLLELSEIWYIFDAGSTGVLICYVYCNVSVLYMLYTVQEYCWHYKLIP